MAAITKPDARPVGSTQVLKWTGSLTPGEALLTYPKTNGRFSSDKIGISNIVVARLLLADPAVLTDLQRQFPELVFDNTQLAATSPAAPTASGVAATVADILNATDLDMSNQAWAQNAYVTVVPIDAATAALAYTCFASQFRFALDSGANSGLGGNSKLPVLCLAIDIGAPQVPISTLAVQITLEIRHTASR